MRDLVVHGTVDSKNLGHGRGIRSAGVPSRGFGIGALSVSSFWLLLQGDVGQIRAQQLRKSSALSQRRQNPETAVCKRNPCSFEPGFDACGTSNLVPFLSTCRRRAINGNSIIPSCSLELRYFKGLNYLFHIPNAATDSYFKNTAQLYFFVLMPICCHHSQHSGSHVGVSEN